MRAILIAAATAGLALAGCSQKVEQRGDQVTVTGVGGLKTTVTKGADAKAAADALPAFAPPYPGATVVTASRSTIGGTLAAAVSLTTPDSPEQVIAFYKTRLEGAGLGKVSDINMGLGRMLIAEDKATGKGVQIMAMKAEGQTRIQISQSTVKPKG